jgi:hypothetical protein
MLGAFLMGPFLADQKYLTDAKLMAMTVAPVSQIAPVREVSTLIGATIGGE